MTDEEILIVWENNICPIKLLIQNNILLDKREIIAFARTIEKPTPQFDVESDEQEDLAIKFCHEIAGPKGKKGSPPDPVRLLEMAEELYKAEMRYRENK